MRQRKPYADYFILQAYVVGSVTINQATKDSTIGNERKVQFKWYECNCKFNRKKFILPEYENSIIMINFK